MAKRFQLSYAPLVAVMAVVVLLMALPSISAQDNKSPEKSISGQDSNSPGPSSSSSGTSDEEFFRKSCSVTPYPDMCNNMVPLLSPSKIKQNHFEMLKSLVHVSMVSYSGAARLFGDMGAQPQVPGQKKGLNPSTNPQNLLEVVKGCSRSFVTITDLKAQAMNQMDQLNSPTSSSSCKAEMKNVETLLYDAIKEEAKCIANLVFKFDEAQAFTDRETKISSNSLALVKDFLTNH